MVIVTGTSSVSASKQFTAQITVTGLDPQFFGLAMQVKANIIILDTNAIQTTIVKFIGSSSPITLNFSKDLSAIPTLTSFQTTFQLTQDPVGQFVHVFVINAQPIQPPTTNTVPDTPIMNNIDPAFVTESTVGLSWRVPSSDGGSPITGYRLVVIKQDSTVIFDENVGNVVSRTVTGLAPDTIFITFVAAINSIGESLASNSKSFTTKAAPVLNLSFVVSGVDYLAGRVNNFKSVLTPSYDPAAVGTVVKYSVFAQDSITNESLKSRVRNITLTPNPADVVRAMNLVIPDELNHQKITVSWIILNTEGFAITPVQIQTLVLEGAPPPPPPPPPPEDGVSTDMIDVSLGVFQLKDDRVTGRVNYIANINFNPFWFGKSLITNFEILDSNGGVIVEKQENINFTETQRDEFIDINELAFGNKTVTVRITTFVSLADVRFFSPQKSVIIEDSTGCPPGFQRNPTTGLCEPIPPPPTEERNLFNTAIVGAIGLGLLASVMGKKK